MKAPYFLIVLLACSILFANTAFAISLDDVVCPAKHSTSKTNNLLGEKLHVNDTLAHSVFKIKGQISDKVFEDIGTATLIYKSAEGEAFFITAEHVFGNPDYNKDNPDKNIIDEDEYKNYYLYAPGMSRSDQVEIKKVNIVYWGEHEKGNSKYCEFQGPEKVNENNPCGFAGAIPEIPEDHHGVKNPDIAIFKVEDFSWGSSPVNIDLKFLDVELDGVFHLLGYPAGNDYPLLVSDIPPRQNYGDHFSPSHVYVGQSGGLLVSDYGVAYAVQSKYDNGLDNSNSKKITVTPFSEVMDFLYKILYKLSADDNGVSRQEIIDRFMAHILPNQQSSAACKPETSNCHLVDVRKINLLLRNDWHQALTISLILRDEFWNVMGKDENEEKISVLRDAIEACDGQSLSVCRQAESFSILENHLLSLGANSQNREPLTQMLECTLGKGEAEIYSEFSRLLGILYTTLASNVTEDFLIPARRISGTPKFGLLDMLVKRQRQEISNKITKNIIRKNRSAANLNIFRNVTEAKEESETAINLAGLISSTCNAIDKDYHTAIASLELIQDEKSPPPKNYSRIRHADGYKSSAEGMRNAFKKAYKYSVSSVNDIEKCYGDNNKTYHEEREKAVIYICKKAIRDTTYYNNLPKYSRDAIEESMERKCRPRSAS